MIRVHVELSGESLPLASAEAVAAAEALGGAGDAAAPAGNPPLVTVELTDERSVVELAGRLALARRCLVHRARPSDATTFLSRAGASGATASVRRLGSPTAGGDDAEVLAAGRAYREGGGRIELERPQHRFWLARGSSGVTGLFEEIASVDRRSPSDRRMPRLPFQRPVSLDPRFARAAANLARVRAGDRIIDPFVGTGALLAEAGLLGARLFGVDREADMVRGALRNLAHLGVGADALVVGDAGEVEDVAPGVLFDAVLTDPPYGRASSTGSERPAELVQRVLPRWADRVRPGGRVVVVTPERVGLPGAGWRAVLDVPVRVHRSLTRRFQVWERPTAPTAPS